MKNIFLPLFSTALLYRDLLLPTAWESNSLPPTEHWQKNQFIFSLFFHLLVGGMMATTMKERHPAALWASSYEKQIVCALRLILTPSHHIGSRGRIQFTFQWSCRGRTSFNGRRIILNLSFLRIELALLLIWLWCLQLAHTIDPKELKGAVHLCTHGVAPAKKAKFWRL